VLIDALDAAGAGGLPDAEEMRIAGAVDSIRSVWPAGAVEVGIILGTGLGGLASRIEVDAVVDYRDVLHMPRLTGGDDRGRLILGRLEGRTVAVLQGRFHLYEGYSARQVAFPVRLLRALGAETLFVSFACGGLRPEWRPGDLVLLDDHINLQGTSPLVGPNDDGVGPRFPDMSEPYDRRLQEVAVAAAAERGIPLRRGVYAAMLGPQLETRAEYRMLGTLGADVVGMSTAAEVIAARHAGMRVLAAGVIVNQCLPDALPPVDVPEILRVAGAAEPLLAELFRAVLAGG